MIGDHRLDWSACGDKNLSCLNPMTGVEFIRDRPRSSQIGRKNIIFCYIDSCHLSGISHTALEQYTLSRNKFNDIHAYDIQTIHNIPIKVFLDGQISDPFIRLPHASVAIFSTISYFLFDPVYSFSQKNVQDNISTRCMSSVN